MDETNEERKEGALETRSSTNDIIERANEAKTMDELREVVGVFSASMMKKSMSRASVQSDLLDDILEKVKDRVENHHDSMSNKELLDYMTAMQTGLEGTKKSLTEIDDAPPITINNTHNEVNINQAHGLNRQSRERVVDTVKKILARINEGQDDEVDAKKSIEEAVGETVNVGKDGL